MRAMILKEVRQLRRDRRTVAMLVVIPVVLLTVFGYAARFDGASGPRPLASARLFMFCRYAAEGVGKVLAHDCTKAIEGILGAVPGPRLEDKISPGAGRKAETDLRKGHCEAFDGI